MEDIKKIIEERSKRIVNSIKEFLNHANLKEFYLAGGCLTKQVRDIDIFPLVTTKANNYLTKKFFISGTKNAETFKFNDQLIQICNYIHPSLESLVNSFDFSHIQIGSHVVIGQSIEIKNVFFTQDFLVAKTVEDSKYTSTEYPLSSLVRLLKYHKRDQISKGQSIWSIINILVDIIDRGFKDYGDFKEQLDAVDLGLLPEDIEKIENSKLLELFKLLKK